MIIDLYKNSIIHIITAHLFQQFNLKNRLKLTNTHLHYRRVDDSRSLRQNKNFKFLYTPKSLWPKKNIQKYIFGVFFPVECDPGVILPLLVQEKAGNSKNQKIEKPS